MPLKKEVQIEFENVSFNYPQNPVLADVTFKIHAGDYVGIIGPNGGGKTTALKLILGLIKPVSGNVRIFGQTAGELTEPALLGYVPQHAAHTSINFPATVKEIVESGRTPRKKIFSFWDAKDKKAVRAAVDAAGINKLKNRLLRELSGGERQRVLVARAIASEPRLLILDEPFEGVDLSAQTEFYEILKTLNKQGMTIIFVTHDVDIISREAREIICLNRRLVCAGNPHDIAHQHAYDHLHGKHIKHTHSV
ncbi:MAG: metal ABC transporter ATP-binding protein [Patescibacteria group bacterium]